MIVITQTHSQTAMESNSEDWKHSAVFISTGEPVVTADGNLKPSAGYYACACSRPDMDLTFDHVPISANIFSDHGSGNTIQPISAQPILNSDQEAATIVNLEALPMGSRYSRYKLSSMSQNGQVTITSFYYRLHCWTGIRATQVFPGLRAQIFSKKRDGTQLDGLIEVKLFEHDQAAFDTLFWHLRRQIMGQEMEGITEPACEVKLSILDDE